MARLTLALLGAPEARHGGKALAFPTRKALALLIYLAVEGGAHTREKLAALLWPDSDEDDGRATLRSTLARLRHALAETDDHRHLVAERDLVRLDASSDVKVDVHRLAAAYDMARALSPPAASSTDTGRSLVAQLEEAAGLCRGEFLEGFSLPDAPDFDDWSRVQREAWHQRVVALLDYLSQLHAEQGRTQSAVDVASRWLRLNPLDERAHRRLMELYLAAGDRAAALRAYETCRTRLERELGVPPAPETESLAERIRATVLPEGPSHPRGSPTVLAPAHLGAPLVGRAGDFAKLVELYHAALQGRPQVAVVEGEAGIGKTRLAAEFLGWAMARGADTLHGRAFETGGRLPYQPLVDAFRPRLERENAPDDLLSDVWLTELSRLLPELRDRYPDLPPPTGDEAAARTRLLEAIARLGQALADRAPLVLFVDDVQWADAASLDALHYVGRRWTEGETPMLLVLALRAESLATAPALGGWVDALGRDLSVTRLALGPLTVEDTLQLVQDLSGGGRPGEAPAAEVERFGRWLFAETSGQPFFLTETLKALLERGALVAHARGPGRWTIELQPHILHETGLRGLLPVGVRNLIRTRLTRLLPAARRLAAAAAVLGQGFDFEQMRRVAGLGEEEALSALDDLLRSHMLREVHDDGSRSGVARYGFAHDKIRDAVYAEAGEARRRVFHRRALDALEAAAAPAAELAHHALAAGLDEVALRLSVTAGDDAVRLLAGLDAAAHYERAIEIAQRLGRTELLPDLHARRGKAFTRVAQWADAKRELEAGLEGLGSDQQERRAEMLVNLLEACWWLLDVPTMRRQAAEAVALAERLGRGDLEVAAIGWLAGAKGAEGDTIGCVAHCQRALVRAGALGVAPPAHVQTHRSLALYWLGRPGEAVESSREAVAAAREARDIPVTMYSLPHLGLALAAAGRYKEAALAFEDARRLGREYGIDALLARSIAMSAGFHLDLFDFAGAEALSREAREKALSLNFLPPAASAGIDLLLNFARRGEAGRTEKLVDEVADVVEQAAGFHGWLWKLRLAQARAEIALARGDWEGTLRLASSAIEQSRARARPKYQVLGLLARARALRARGRAKEAIRDLQNAVRLARPVGDPALFLRAAAELLAADGNDALAAEARAAAERIAEALPDESLRRCFEASDPVRLVARLEQQGPLKEQLPRRE